MKEIHVVGAAIIEGKRILAAQRSQKMKTPLKWEFVGGKVEENETHQQALVREVMEELGVQIAVGKYLATGTSGDGNTRIVLHVYEAELVKGVPQAKEHAQLKWTDINEIEVLDWAEADIPACRKLMEIYA